MSVALLTFFFLPPSLFNWRITHAIVVSPSFSLFSSFLPLPLYQHRVTREFFVMVPERVASSWDKPPRVHHEAEDDRGCKRFPKDYGFRFGVFCLFLTRFVFFRSCCHRIGEIFICLVCLSYHCENDGSKLWGRNEVVWDKVTCLFFIDIWCFVVVAWSTFFSWSQFTFLFWYYVMLRWTSVWPCGDQLFKLIICAWFCCQKNKNKRKTWFCRPLSR